MKTIYDPAVRDELLKRVDNINPKLQSQWGKMSIDQMVHHINLTYAAYFGEVTPTPRGSAFKKRLLKFLALAPTPIPKGKAETLPEFVANENYKLDEEKARLQSYIKRMSALKSQDTWPVSAAFGPLDAEEYGRLSYKHTDHHFKQFGV